MSLDARPRLSICIPTHNFGAFIGATLDSILTDCPDRVEVIVLDCGSTDATEVVVASRQAGATNLAYHARAAKGGIDRDMATAVDLANAPYCWLFSADDVMYPGAVASLLDHLASGADVYLLAHSDSLVDLTVTRSVHPVLDVAGDSSFELGNIADRQRYLERALSTEAFFSFMSGLCVRTERWRSVSIDERFVGSCWAHAARLLSLATEGLSVRFVNTPLLNRRGDNDSFATHGVVKRYALAIEGYQRIAAEIFGADSVEAYHIRRVLRAEFTVADLLYAKSLTAAWPDREDRGHLDRLASRLFSDAGPGNWCRRAIYRTVPVLAYDSLRKLWRRLRKLQPHARKPA